MKEFAVFTSVFISSVGAANAQEIGFRVFDCVPAEVYQMTPEGLRMAPEDVFKALTDGREFLFDEATGIKSEPQTGKSVQYTVLNPQNLIGTPVVAMYGKLNPSFLRLAMMDENDPAKFVFFLFGGSINVFGRCTVSD